MDGNGLREGQRRRQSYHRKRNQKRHRIQFWFAIILGPGRTVSVEVPMIKGETEGRLLSACRMWTTPPYSYHLAYTYTTAYLQARRDTTEMQKRNMICYRIIRNQQFDCDDCAPRW